jgi:hypothetical protein
VGGRIARAAAIIRHVRKAVLAALATGLLALAAGCGGEASEGPATPEPATETPAKLTAQERRLVSSYEGAIESHCVRVSQSLVDPPAAPSLRQEEAAFEAADELVALAADKPTAPYGPGQDLRLFVSDVVENLEGSNCDPRMIARLEQGLAEIPVS